MLTKYLFIPHTYGVFDCIVLVKQFYEHEFNLNIQLPNYTTSRAWMKEFSSSYVEQEVKKYAKKVNLVDAQNYDLILFNINNYIIHFGIYLMPNKMLHIEEGRRSCIETISDTWAQRIFGIYRINNVV